MNHLVSNVEAVKYMSDLIDHDKRLTRLADQMSHTMMICAEMRTDIKSLVMHSERQRERDAMYDKCLRAIPIVFALLSGGYWILSRLK